ncbi:hypothetical protein IKF43_01325 [Candidatus Saccharibacteria bacterium]|nr:hypothetical protein [Candidatus Saccharibacteria bacterium]
MEKTILVRVNQKGDTDRMVGKITKNPETQQTNPTTTDQDFIGDLANLLASSKRFVELSNQAEEKMKLASEANHQIKEQKKKNAKAAKKANFLSKTAFIRTAILTVLGFIAGAAVVIQEILEQHGPTVTIKGTLEATILYVLSGLFFGLTIGGFAFTCFKSDYKDYKRRIKKGEARIDELKEQANTYTLEAAKLNELSVKELIKYNP